MDCLCPDWFCLVWREPDLADCTRDDPAGATGGFFLWWGWGHEVYVISAGEFSVGSFDVRVFASRRRPGRTASEVRWRVAGRDRSRSFITWALADSYRAELVRAARKGAEFDPVTGELQRRPRRSR